MDPLTRAQRKRARSVRETRINLETKFWNGDHYALGVQPVHSVGECSGRPKLAGRRAGFRKASFGIFGCRRPGRIEFREKRLDGNLVFPRPGLPEGRLPIRRDGFAHGEPHLGTQRFQSRLGCAGIRSKWYGKRTASLDTFRFDIARRIINPRHDRMGYALAKACRIVSGKRRASHAIATLAVISSCHNTGTEARASGPPARQGGLQRESD